MINNEPLQKRQRTNTNNNTTIPNILRTAPTFNLLHRSKRINKLLLQTKRNCKKHSSPLYRSDKTCNLKPTGKTQKE